MSDPVGLSPSRRPVGRACERIGRAPSHTPEARSTTLGVGIEYGDFVAYAEALDLSAGSMYSHETPAPGNRTLRMFGLFWMSCRLKRGCCPIAANPKAGNWINSQQSGGG